MLPLTYYIDFKIKIKIKKQKVLISSGNILSVAFQFLKKKKKKITKGPII